MDIITHTLSGIAISTVFASLSKKKLWKKGIVIFCGGIGGAIPDIDVISLWSGFDATFGKFFHLTTKGKDIYFSNYWYSHHNFTHSLVGGCVMILFFLLLLYPAFFLFAKEKNFTNFLRSARVYSVTFFFTYFTHLLGDLPTPGHTWGGIKLFWPITAPIGGIGKIWWWNNYDIFLITLVCCFMNIGILITYQVFQKKFMRYLPIMIFLCSFLVVLYQIEQRNFNFSKRGYAKKYNDYEKKSLEIQKNILGEDIYDIMVKFDRKLTLYF